MASTWLYAPDISAQTAHGTISLGRKLVLDLYYLIDPRNVATIGYQVINLPSGTNNQYGNGDYGATEPTFELIAGGTHNVPNGSTAQTPPGYVFLGWYAHLSDIAGGVAPLSTDLTFIPPVPAAGWVVGDTYTYYAIFRELEDIEISYDFTPSNGGSVSIDHDSFAPVTGKPKAVYTTPNPASASRTGPTKMASGSLQTALRSKAPTPGPRYLRAYRSWAPPSSRSM